MNDSETGITLSIFEVRFIIHYPFAEDGLGRLEIQSQYSRIRKKKKREREILLLSLSPLAWKPRALTSKMLLISDDLFSALLFLLLLIPHFNTWKGHCLMQSDTRELIMMMEILPSPQSQTMTQAAWHSGGSRVSPVERYYRWCHLRSSNMSILSSKFLSLWMLLPEIFSLEITI